MDWVEQGACRGMDTELFIPAVESNIKHYPEEVIEACKRCPVQQECLDWAVRHEAYGYWGGMSSKQRKIMRHKQKISFKSPSAIIAGFKHGTRHGYRRELELVRTGRLKKPCQECTTAERIANAEYQERLAKERKL